MGDPHGFRLTAAAQLAPVRPAPGERSELTELVAGLRRGENREEVFREVFLRCRRLVRRAIESRGVGRADAEDLVQETFLRAFRGVEGYRGEGSFESWLIGIARNVHRQHQRAGGASKRSGRETSLEAALETEGTGRSGDDAADPVARLERRERLHRVSRVLEGMPAQMRRCATLRLVQDFSYREIADLLQLSMDSVKVQLHRARARLRDALRDERDGRRGNGT